MFIIGQVTVEKDVMTSSFCCDISACKGACCTLEGGRGAPLEDNEVNSIRDAFEAVRPMLSEESLNAISKQGLVEGNAGDYVTPCINENECVYAIIENGIASCSFERAYLRGLTSWRKPISCHLFPIRRSRSNHLRYEQIRECSPGRDFGKNKKIALHEFLREPLTRIYGNDWFNSLSEYSNLGSDSA